MSNLKTYLAADEIQKLAMFYVQNQDLSNLAPNEIFEKYIGAYNQIVECSNKLQSESKAEKQKNMTANPFL